ncbi:hypothetical protein OJF2_63510 [Aquisphaera giovannonii]|uniref:Uncharacterized protein n=1 Tax=Aquisphaera giovannonii TaxID=406548 RepID=A0A5B9WD03_9BACT|nr:hypothetical protein [Aquisphaera giovannonii]QEH37760.1 hypothetical protein OJF2_63510 [Aquisphaera giovannonii]
MTPKRSVSLVVPMAVLATLAAGAVAGPLSRGPQIPVKTSELSVLVYRGGHVVERRQLAPGSEASVAIDGALSRRGWTTSFLTYAPSVYLQDSKGQFTINVSGELLIINDSTGRWPRQRIRTLDEEEARSIRRALRAELGTPSDLP